MFPIPWNFPFRKKDGSMSTISAEMGGVITPATVDKLGGIKVGSGLAVTSDGTLSGVNELPSHTISEAGKVLTVGDDGSLEWDESGAGGGIYTTGVLRPTLYGPYDNTKFKVGALANPVSRGSALSASQCTSESYDITELLDFSIGNFIEIQSYLNSYILTALSAVQLANITEAGTSVELSNPFTNYDVIILQGVYDTSGGTSQYDTTILQKNTELNTSYWFGVKDRNSSYSGTITFTDNTHATLSESRRIKIYGFNL